MLCLRGAVLPIDTNNAPEQQQMGRQTALGPLVASGPKACRDCQRAGTRGKHAVQRAVPVFPRGAFIMPRANRMKPKQQMGCLITSQHSTKGAAAPHNLRQRALHRLALLQTVARHYERP